MCFLFSIVLGCFALIFPLLLLILPLVKDNMEEIVERGESITKGEKSGQIIKSSKKQEEYHVFSCKINKNCLLLIRVTYLWPKHNMLHS